MCASLNHLKKTKADGSRLIPRKHTETLVLLSVKPISCDEVRLRGNTECVTIARRKDWNSRFSKRESQRNFVWRRRSSASFSGRWNETKYSLIEISSKRETSWLYRWQRTACQGSLLKVKNVRCLHIHRD